MSHNMQSSFIGVEGAIVELQKAFLAKVYAWMVGGLLLTGLTAAFVISSPTMLEILFSGRFTFIALLLAELGLVVFLSARIGSMSNTAATASFLTYSFLNGVTLSVLFLVYTSSSLASTFFIAAGMFGAMSLYGFATKRDLSGVGSFMFMGLIGIILASIMNFFVDSSALEFAISVIGVFVFVGLTAYDVQKIKEMYEVEVNGNGEISKNIAIYGALTLYLDFINLFLFLLRLLGRRD